MPKGRSSKTTCSADPEPCGNGGGPCVMAEEKQRKRPISRSALARHVRRGVGRGGRGQLRDERRGPWEREWTVAGHSFCGDADGQGQRRIRGREGTESSIWVSPPEEERKGARDLAGKGMRDQGDCCSMRGGVDQYRMSDMYSTTPTVHPGGNKLALPSEREQRWPQGGMGTRSSGSVTDMTSSLGPPRTRTGVPEEARMLADWQCRRKKNRNANHPLISFMPFMECIARGHGRPERRLTALHRDAFKARSPRPLLVVLLASLLSSSLLPSLLIPSRHDLTRQHSING
ncbi:hypothetical protein CALCODRAFT_245512 [Calocera cornea HHB12733]|uniref:Uncharacterized protein n=1 Tax=Calocera cornea HHB12733 TaxID=1353952 RepID=A0A165JU09_9BASI|nr:hypothetical protein CALCODRAFT_245512 [Calocera cornea HHB12733]